jgi:phenylacetaldehyde dehydrogenase
MQGTTTIAAPASETTTPLLPSVVDWLGSRRLMLIDGQAVDSSGTLEVEDPATGQHIAQVALAEAAHVDAAVVAARRAFESREWRWMPAMARGRLLTAAATVVEQHAEELAQLDALDAGLPITLSRALLTGSLESMHYAAGIPARLSGESLVPAGQAGDQMQAQVIREPMGVVAQILPWNTPLSMAIEKLVLALATGNTVVVKPAEQTPLSALRLAELLHELDLPPGVLNVVPGFGAEAGAALVEHPGVDKISFTGSTVTGKRIVAAAAANLTRVSLELGGKSPFIVCADADIEAAAAAAAANGFYHSGQACTEPARIMVHRDVYDDFAARLRDAAASFPFGPPLDPATVAGPVVSAVQRDRVLAHIDTAREEGATIAYGGEGVDGPGYYVKPTVITGTAPDMRIEREEVFGPVVSVSPYATTGDVIRRANDTSYGLAAGVWTNDLAIAQRMTRELRAGNVWINCYNMFDAALPFGGYGQSGWGRESGTAAVELYTQTKTVVVAT